MTKNNNMWSALTQPIKDRPGTPSHNAPLAHKPAAPPVRGPAPKSKETMPAEDVAKAHTMPGVVDNPWKLSPRQMQVLDMMVQGMSPTSIARMLDLSKSAVSKYTTEIRERMEVVTNAQAVVAWHRHYRVLQPDRKSVDQDDTLIANLARVTEQLRADRKEAA